MTAAVELVAAVREFIAGLALDGREAFHAKVAANALAIVERELAGNAAAVEAAALLPFTSPRRKPGLGFAAAIPGGAAMLDAVERKPSPGFRRGDGQEEGRQADEGTSVLRAMLCVAIRETSLNAATPGLLDALVAATCARLAVDNPRYATLARLQLPASDAAVRR